MPEAQAAQIEFSISEGYVPTFANAVTLTAINGEFIINFGFIDPLAIKGTQLEKQSDEEQQGVIKLQAELVARLAINPLVASNLLEQLSEALADIQEEEEK